MNEPKKRGRPSKADIAAREAQQPGQVPHINGDAEYVPDEKPSDDSADRAQALAMRVWAGQSDHLLRSERIERIERALTSQGLPTDGVKYPGESADDWTAEDEQPISWKVKLPKAEGIV